jgi:hypothetical protein
LKAVIARNSGKKTYNWFATDFHELIIPLIRHGGQGHDVGYGDVNGRQQRLGEPDQHTEQDQPTRTARKRKAVTVVAPINSLASFFPSVGPE